MITDHCLYFFCLSCMTYTVCMYEFQLRYADCKYSISSLVEKKTWCTALQLFFHLYREKYSPFVEFFCSQAFHTVQSEYIPQMPQKYNLKIKNTTWVWLHSILKLIFCAFVGSKSLETSHSTPQRTS